MQVKSIAECSPWSILQYFRPLLSYHLSLTPLFFVFLSGRLRQVLLYNNYLYGWIQKTPSGGGVLRAFFLLDFFSQYDKGCINLPWDPIASLGGSYQYSKETYNHLGISRGPDPLPQDLPMT